MYLTVPGIESKSSVLRRGYFPPGHGDSIAHLCSNIDYESWLPLDFDSQHTTFI